MKRKVKWWYLLGCVALIGVGFVFGHYAGAASAAPGSAEDPLVTLSYLESRIVGQSTAGERVQLSKGQILMGVPGTSFIVLGGSVTAKGDGLVDVTKGARTEKETSLFLYHNYIVSDENVGCEALSGCTILVCGKYVIK